MSSILKALRKIEEEKRVANHAAPDLRVDQGGTSARSKSLLPLVSGVAIGVACVGSFVLWQSSYAPEAVEQLQPKLQAPASIVTNSNLPEDKSVASDEIIEAGSAASSDQNDKQLKSAQTRMQLEHDSTATVAKETQPMVSTARDVTVDNSVEADSALKEVSLNNPATDSPAEKMTLAEPVVIVESFDVPEPKAAPEQKTLATETVTREVPAESQGHAKEPHKNDQLALTTLEPVTASSSLPLPEGVSLQVTEIFFQEESVNSIALVNDLPVMVGTHVDSAVVHEIRPDAVIFEIDKEKYRVDVISPQ